MSFYQQTTKVIDVIFPLFEVDTDGDNAVLVGTGFLIGPDNHALTAGHVMKSLDDTRKYVAGFVASNGYWVGAEVLEWEIHPTEDVACLVLNPEQALDSFLQLSGTAEYGSMPFELWGYPEDVAHDSVRDGKARLRPDVVFLAGRVRRRMGKESAGGHRGTQFLELPLVGGHCVSGAPIIKTTGEGKNWTVVGIYIGERYSTREDEPPVIVGIAAYEYIFGDWQPSFLSRSIREESQRGNLIKVVPSDA